MSADPTQWTDVIIDRKPMRGVISLNPPISRNATGDWGVEGTAPPPVIDIITRPARPIAVVQQPQAQPGIQLSTTHLLIGAAILFFLLKGK